MANSQSQLPSLGQGQYYGLPNYVQSGLSPVSSGMNVLSSGLNLGGLAGTGMDNVDDLLKLRQSEYLDRQMNPNMFGFTSQDMQGMQGIAGLAGTLGQMYYANKANDRAAQVLNMQKQDRANQYASNKKWNDSVAAAGWGTGTRSVLG